MGTVVWFDGFDEWDAAEVSVQGYLTGGSVTSMAGRVAGRALIVNGGSLARAVPADAWYSVAVAWQTSVTTDNSVFIQLHEGATLHGSARYNGDGTFSVLRGTTVLATSTGQGIGIGVWYHLELDYKVGSSDGEYELRLNGATIIGRTTSANTRNSGTAGTIDTATLYESGNGLFYFDDYIVTKGGGFNGDCRVITSMPDADGTNTDWTLTGRPSIQAVGTSVNSTAAATLVWPAHEAGDIGLLLCESTGGQPVLLSTPSGFVAVDNSPQATGATTAGTQLSVFWCRATSAFMPSVVTNDPGDHVSGVIVTIRGCDETGNPWNVSGGGVKATTSTAFSATGVTTTVDNSLVVVMGSGDPDTVGTNWNTLTNANLTSLTKHFDEMTTQGNGGGLMLASGVKATAGATGSTTATLTTSAIDAFLTLAFPPATSEWEVVQATDDDAYLSSGTAGNRSTFGFPDLGVTGTVLGVSVGHLSRKDDAGTRLMVTSIRRGGTNYDNTTTQALGTDYAYQHQLYLVDPATSAGWTVSNIDAGEFGIKLDT